MQSVFSHQIRPAETAPVQDQAAASRQAAVASRPIPDQAAAASRPIPDPAAAASAQIPDLAVLHLPLPVFTSASLQTFRIFFTLVRIFDPPLVQNGRIVFPEKS